LGCCGLAKYDEDAWLTTADWVDEPIKNTNT
jgi:hypothetical protein